MKARNTAYLMALAAMQLAAQSPGPGDGAEGAVTVLRPARVFDGAAMHDGWSVRVRGNRIDAAGPTGGIGATGAKVIDLPGMTLMPGLVEGHSHILLHAYSETPWVDQVAHESLGVRTAGGEPLP